MFSTDNNINCSTVIYVRYYVSVDQLSWYEDVHEDMILLINYFAATRVSELLSIREAFLSGC